MSVTTLIMSVWKGWGGHVARKAGEKTWYEITAGKCRRQKSNKTTRWTRSKKDAKYFILAISFSRQIQAVRLFARQAFVLALLIQTSAGVPAILSEVLLDSRALCKTTLKRCLQLSHFVPINLQGTTHNRGIEKRSLKDKSVTNDTDSDPGMWLPLLAHIQKVRSSNMSSATGFLYFRFSVVSVKTRGGIFKHFPTVSLLMFIDNHFWFCYNFILYYSVQ